MDDSVQRLHAIVGLQIRNLAVGMEQEVGEMEEEMDRITENERSKVGLLSYVDHMHRVSVFYLRFFIPARFRTYIIIILLHLFYSTSITGEETYTFKFIYI